MRGRKPKRRNNMEPLDVEKYVTATAQVHDFAYEVARILADTAVPEFSSEPINVEDAAKLIGLKPAQIRAGIQYGWLPIGIAINRGKIIKGRTNVRLNFVIFPRKIWEVTEHVCKGNEALKNK